MRTVRTNLAGKVQGLVADLTGYMVDMARSEALGLEGEKDKAAEMPRRLV